MKMGFSLAGVLCAGLLVVAAEPQAAAVKAELERLQGNWTIASIETKGQPLNPEQLPRGVVAIAGQEMSAKDDNFKFKLALKVYPDTQPLAVDLELDGKGAAKDVVEAICTVEGDTLKLCLTGTPNLKERPAEFATRPDGNTVLIVFKRVQP